MDEFKNFTTEDLLAGMLAYVDGFHWSALTDGQIAGWFAASWSTHLGQFPQVKVPNDQS